MEGCKVISINRSALKAKPKRTLPQNVVELLISEICFDESISMPGKHVELFCNRQYSSMLEIRRALRRYKVFGDLGYGGQNDKAKADCDN